MYEKPQYLTPGGFRRLKNNPLPTKVEKKAPVQIATTNPLELKPILRPIAQKKKGVTISDAAAKRIAEALTIMLRSGK